MTLITLFEHCVTWLQGVASAHCVTWQWTTEWTSLPW
jgi:hypothetical protein